MLVNDENRCLSKGVAATATVGLGQGRQSQLADDWVINGFDAGNFLIFRDQRAIAQDARLVSLRKAIIIKGPNTRRVRLRFLGRKKKKVG